MHPVTLDGTTDQLNRPVPLTIPSIKTPKSLDFVDGLPRGENGKLYKRELKDRYWANRENNLV